MTTTKKKTSQGKFWILILLSIVLGIVVYGFMLDQFGMQFLVFFSGLPFLLFTAGLFGLLWPVIKPAGEETYISHALIIGVLFLILFFIHVWLVLPRICPEFGACLGV